MKCKPYNINIKYLNTTILQHNTISCGISAYIEYGTAIPPMGSAYKHNTLVNPVLDLICGVLTEYIHGDTGEPGTSAILSLQMNTKYC